MDPKPTHLVTFDVATQTLDDAAMKAKTADRVQILLAWARENAAPVEIIQTFDLFGIAAIKTTPQAALGIATLPIVRSVEMSRVLRATGV